MASMMKKFRNKWCSKSMAIFAQNCIKGIREANPKGGGGGAFECKLTGMCPFLKEKFAFRYPVSELLDYKEFQNNRETIVYCSRKQ